MDTLLQDVRYGFRTLTRKPVFTTVAILSLALGIGANTTIFTLVNAVFLNPIPVQEPSRLAQVFTTDENQRVATGSLLPVSFRNYEDFRAENSVFSGLVCVAFNNVVVTEGEEPRPVQGQLVSGNYFEVLGIEAAHGSLRLPDLGEPVEAVVVLSHSLWQQEFGGDPSVVGRPVSLGGAPFTVVGVAPEGFKGTFTINDPNMAWLPLSMWERLLTGQFRDFFDHRRALFTQVFGRLRPGVGREQAAAELKTIARRLEEEYPDANRGRSVAVTPLATTAPNPNQEDQFALAGTLLMAVVGLVLLIACANVANLLLGRAADREKEIGIRIALGAGRVRLIRQLLTESVLLALAGGALGLLIAGWSRGLLWYLMPPGPGLGPEALDLSLDAVVLGFTLVVSLLTGVVFGLVPALQTTRPDMKEALQEGGRRGSSGSSSRTLRSGLVVAEVALALVALIGAGLFVRSMQNAQRVDPGFESERLLSVQLDPHSIGYEQEEADALFRRVVDRVGGLGAVEAAALSTAPPLGAFLMRSVVPEDYELPDGSQGLLTLVDTIGAGYFRTLEIPLLQGRALDRSDNADGTPVAVVNEAAARRFWPEEKALGKTIRFYGGEADLRIVGVVADTLNNLGQPPQPKIYVPHGQNPAPAMLLQVRTSGDPRSAVASVRGAVREIEPNLPLDNVQTVDEILEQNLWAPRLGATLLGVFGLLALLLSVVGIYGVMSHAVNRRAHEVGIRMALGARSRDVVGMVLRQGMALVGLGLLLGLGAAFLATRLIDIRTFLWDVSPTDPLVWVGITTILTAVALVANLLPARRITRIDPIRALREE